MVLDQLVRRYGTVSMADNGGNDASAHIVLAPIDPIPEGRQGDLQTPGEPVLSVVSSDAARGGTVDIKNSVRVSVGSVI